MHVPVMLDEALQYLAVRPDGVYVDATAGLGGHTAAIAARLGAGRLWSNDRDAESLAMARENAAPYEGRVTFTQGAFSTLAERLRAAGVEKADGLLADLGVSRYQLTAAERGFSLQSDGPLDMRMDRSAGHPASEIVNFYSEKELANLIFELGEERRSRQIARAIVRARPIRSTLHLAGVVEQAAPRTGRLHPATQTFMALRLFVNSEPEELDALLESAPGLVKPGGRIVIISFMSLEDRKVKQRFQSLARSGEARVLTKHVIPPGELEVRSNPPSRSAKLRAVEMCA